MVGIYTEGFVTAAGGAGAAANDIGSDCGAAGACQDEVGEGQDYKESELRNHLVIIKAYFWSR